MRASWRYAQDAQLRQSTIDALRERLTDRLLAASRDAEARGQPALAALHEIEAQRTGARIETKVADRVRAGAAVRLSVVPFEVREGDAAAGALVAAALHDRIAADAVQGSTVLRVDDAASAPGGFPNLVVTGVVLSQRRARAPAGAEPKTVRYVAATRPVANPVNDDLLAKIQASQMRRDAADRSVADAKARVRKILDMAYGTAGAGPQVTQDNPVWQQRLAAARRELAELETKAGTVAIEERALLRKLQGTSATADEPVWAEATVDVATVLYTAQMTARVRLLDGATVLFDEEMTASAEHRETSHPAVPEAALPEDTDDVPSAADMAARAADRLAAVAAGPLRAAAERAAGRVLEHARERRAAGAKEAAAEAYALYLLSTSETASPGRAEAARAVAELTGFRTALRTGWESER
jgi:hypothetical protein